jgi:hypothetical protein
VRILGVVIGAVMALSLFWGASEPPLPRLRRCGHRTHGRPGSNKSGAGEESGTRRKAGLAPSPGNDRSKAIDGCWRLPFQGAFVEGLSPAPRKNADYSAMYGPRLELERTPALLEVNDRAAGRAWWLIAGWRAPARYLAPGHDDSRLGLRKSVAQVGRRQSRTPPRGCAA